MCIFWKKKTVKIVSASIASGGWDSAPRPLRCYSRLLLQFFEFVSHAKCILFRSKTKPSNYCKCSAFAFYTILYLFL